MDRRHVTVATISLPHYGAEVGDDLKPRNQQGLFDLALPLLKEAGQSHPDFIAIPELFGSFGIPESVTPAKALAEPVPGTGPAFSFLQEHATKLNTNLVTTILERDGDSLYNCGLIVDRQGWLAGKYRKTHLPPEERPSTCAGDTYPVFEIEGVRCGILTCFDLNFPEAARCLGIQKVDIIFWPHMWGAPRDWAYDDAIMRARAGENLCFLVSSALVRNPALGGSDLEIMGRSAIVKWNAEVIAEVGHRVGTVSAILDLDEDRFVQAEYDHMLGLYRRTETYRPLVEELD